MSSIFSIPIKFTPTTVITIIIIIIIIKSSSSLILFHPLASSQRRIMGLWPLASRIDTPETHIIIIITIVITIVIFIVIVIIVVVVAVPLCDWQCFAINASDTNEFII